MIIKIFNHPSSIDSLSDQKRPAVLKGILAKNPASPIAQVFSRKGKPDWTKKMWHIYTMEYYAAIKNVEFVSFVGTWMNLETIILSKLTQEQKIKHHISHS